jgi:hypothetical protein
MLGRQRFHAAAIWRFYELERGVTRFWEATQPPSAKLPEKEDQPPPGANRVSKG